MGAAAAAAPVTRVLSIPGGGLDPRASSSLHCITKCGHFGSRRAGDGALVATRPHSYHWACNETMDFFIRVLTLTACLPCIHCLPRCSVRSVGNGRKRGEMSPCHIFRKYPFGNGLLTNDATRVHVRCFGANVLWRCVQSEHTRADVDASRERVVSASPLSSAAHPVCYVQNACARTCAGANVTYKPTYFRPPAFPAVAYGANAATQFFAVVTVFKSPACTANINAATRFLSGCCCHGDRGAGPLLWDLKTTWSKDPCVITGRVRFARARESRRFCRCALHAAMTTAVRRCGHKP